MRALPDVGRARRFAEPDGTERWCLPPGADAIAARLLTLGQAGIGGFRGREDPIDGDPQGRPWLLRGDLGQTLDAWWKGADGHGVPWRAVIRVFVSVATALAYCEEHSLFVGPLGPKEIWVDDRGGAHAAGLRGDALVRSLVGDASAAVDSGGLSRWTPPAQARGQAWDNQANRYAFGLMLYRALAGEHPFRGKGLRLELAAQEQRGAPPMPEQVSAALPPGLQSLCLRLLDPDPARRPASCAAIADKLRRLAAAPDRTQRPLAMRPSSSSPTPAPTSTRPANLGTSNRAASAAPRRRGWWSLLSVLLPVLAAAGALVLAGQFDPAPPQAPAGKRVGAVTPLGPDQTSPEDCVACHPDQTAQWHGSVMAHSVKSPLFQGLEILIEEQVGKDFGCPGGAGILRTADAGRACRDPNTGVSITGSGGALWCVNCHSPGENLSASMLPWDGISSGGSRTRLPLRDILPADTMEGISCAFCHQVHSSVTPGNERSGLYEGNPTWTSTQTGQRFFMRPEDGRGRFGVGNSGYFLDPAELFDPSRPVPTAKHARPTDEARAYLRSSRFCGACHDVRLFGTDAIEREPFKRLRNAYSEWVDWAQLERAAGREPASCQDCHMSVFPGACVPEGDAPADDPSNRAWERVCPPGYAVQPKLPGTRALEDRSTHYLTGVDVPLTPEFPPGLIDDATLDANGIPRGATQRRDLLLGASFRFEVEPPSRGAGVLEIPIVIENVGAGHKIPAGFSQEREFWVHLKVSDASGRVLYEVGRVDRPGEDLHDKRFVRVNVNDTFTDRDGRPLGVFGADVVDGPDVPQWRGAFGSQRGRGLINLQNGFLRCVTCIGQIDRFGRCQPGLGQGFHRADRFADGAYDIDTGICESNLRGEDKFLEVYFPVGSLDSTRGAVKGPDAIIDTRSAPPGVPLRWVYELSARGSGPFTVDARLMFRAFPPFLIKAFADYEAQQAARGLRPSGPLVTREMLDRLDVVELHAVEVIIP